MIQTTRLSNGITVVSRHLPHRQSVALGVWLLNGTRHEARHESGYAHLLEHLLFKGTHSLDAVALARRFDAMGGQVNAFTGRELTALHGLVPRDELDNLLQLFVAMLRTPRFDDTDLAVETKVVFQEMAMVQDNPEETLEEMGVAHAWADHPMGRPVLGDRAALEAARAADVRAYLQTILSGERVWVVATGAVDHAALVDRCAGLIDLPARPAPQLPAPCFEHGAREMDIGESEQTPLLWLLPAPAPTDDDYYAAVLANHVLGSGNSSRLFQAVREQRGLVYGIQSRIETYSDTGLWLIQTACDPERADECRAAVESTVDQLLDAGVPDAELDLARRHLGAGLLMEDDDLEAIMERLAREAIYLARHPSLEEQIARLQRVTASQLLAALAARWDRRLYMSAAPAVDAEDD